MTRLAATLLLASVLASTVHGREPDLDNGEEINEVCAGCHGEYGEGGKDGEYPRIAGQPPGFIAHQLRLFRARVRANMPMLPHTEERELPDKDIEDVAAYIAAIRLKTRLPPVDEKAPGFDAFARLMEAKRMLNIARFEGDFEAGERLYRKECGSCHGREGEGKASGDVPMLAGQYTNYLLRQVKKYIAKERIHDPEAPEEELLADFSAEELRNIFAYLSVVDDR